MFKDVLTSSVRVHANQADKLSKDFPASEPQDLQPKDMVRQYRSEVMHRATHRLPPSANSWATPGVVEETNP